MKKVAPVGFFVALFAAIASASFFVAWLIWSNTAIKTSTISVSSRRVPKAFSGFRIAQISDLHNACFGKNNEKLIGKLLKAAPDIIVITGDLIDSRDTNVEAAKDFVKKACQIAPVYYVLGNHEARLLRRGELKIGASFAGATVLQDKAIRLAQGDDEITLVGILDSVFTPEHYNSPNEFAKLLTEKLKRLVDSDDDYNILLSHRPELFEIYANCGLDLVFSGHAHGGQFRLPFLGGLYAPSQGLFPKYDAGLYTQGRTNMVVSRGLGKSVVPLRFNNRPEIVLVQLTRPQDS